MTAEAMHIFTTDNKRYKGNLKILKEIEKCAIQGYYKYIGYDILDSFTQNMLETLGYKTTMGLNKTDPWYSIEW